MDAAQSQADHLTALIQQDLVAEVSRQLKLAPEDLDPANELDEYGFDSITLHQFAVRLAEVWSLDLTAADLIEHTSLSALAEYFATEHTVALRGYYQDRLDCPVGPPSAPAAVPVVPPSPAPRREAAPAVASAPRPAGQPGYEPIAVIGMSGTFPQSRTLAQFWKHLAAGHNLITELPAERKATWTGFEELETESAANQPRWAGLMPDVDRFDPLFFNISPKEAEMMDPQQRIFLQAVWETIEDAGYKASSLHGSRTGLFVGVASSDYVHLSVRQCHQVEMHGIMGSNTCLLPNRVSFFMDWCGPSEPIDTACSSSLVAVHRAIRAIHEGDCDLAVAGGVSALLSPIAYVGFSKAGMLAPDGRCKSFGIDADGYVRGEGVAALLLKPLARAVADGDQIHAVIRGSAVNHGGHVSSLTVPSSNAQAECLVTAHERAGFDPATITYIEAHGTGTRVGDPKEFEGLRDGFAELRRRRGGAPVAERSCGLGSVKTNMGHLEGAAGIAGLIKVILCMRHRTLPANLHFRGLNPAIRLEGTPFFVVREAQPWRQITDDAGRLLPRRAGVNSFGYGGVNAHVALEEYVAPEPDTRALLGVLPQVFVLSARNRERLQAYAERLGAWLQENQDCDLRDVAHTLQTGREEMGERLAIIAADRLDLVGKLDRCSRGEQAADVFQGTTRRRRDGRGVSSAAAQGPAAIRTIAQDWVQGSTVDWRELHAGSFPRRVSLPTYPFEQKRYWLPQSEAPVGTAKPPPASRPAVHPLTERLNPEGIFGKTFSGEEFVLRDHCVAGHAILPAVASLEMAWVAASQTAVDRRVLGLKNVVWLRPMVSTGSPVSAELRFQPDGNTLKFQVVSRTAPADDWDLHSQGRVLLGEANGAAPEAVNAVDLESIKRRAVHHLFKETLYEKGRAVGFGYGPGFQAVEELWANPQETLSRLKLPAHLSSGFPSFVLHPSLLDGALQTISGLSLGHEAEFRLVPVSFSLGHLRLIAPLTEECYAYAVRAESRGREDKPVKKYNITILNSEGQPCVVLENYMSRGIPPSAPTAAPVPEPSIRDEAVLVPAPDAPSAEPPLFAAPFWEDDPNPTNSTHPAALGVVLVVAGHESLFRKLSRGLNGSAQMVWLRPGSEFRAGDNGTCQVDPDRGDHYQQLFDSLGSQGREPGIVVNLLGWDESGPVGAGSAGAAGGRSEQTLRPIFQLAQAWLKSKSKRKPLRLLHFAPLNDPSHEAVDGFARSLRLEHPNLDCRSVYLDQTAVLSDSVLAELGRGLERGLSDESGSEVRYLGSHRQVRYFGELTPIQAVPPPLKPKGVYLITGGLGGLGQMLARRLASSYGARLILAGRTAASERSAGVIDEVRRLGGEAIYVPADVSDAVQAAQLVARSNAQFGGLNGVIFASGVLQDGAFINKMWGTFRTVWAAKVEGAVNLDLATREEPLDFFALYSSLSSVTGNRGQTDYAAANRFLDGFAVWREAQRGMGKRSGVTVSINWSYWAGGGMRMSEKAVEFMRHSTGLVPLTDEVGVRAFETVLTLGRPQVAVLAGDKVRLRALAKLRPMAPEAAAPRPVAGAGTEDVLAALAELFSRALKVTPAELDPDTEVEEYGVDSIVAMEILRAVEQRFDTVVDPSTLMEFPTLRGLAQHLVEAGVAGGGQGIEQGRTAERAISPPPALAEARTAATPEATRLGVADPLPPRAETPPEARAQAAQGGHSLQAPQPIAVIGLACRLPGSPSLEVFWENLCRGVHMVREVPEQRWPRQSYYHPDKGAPGLSYSKWASLIDDVEMFDAAFFGISPVAARGMDPQHRLVMELCQELLDRSGYAKEDLRGSRTGVFIGGGQSSYLLDHADQLTEEDLPQAIVNGAPNMLAGRLSDFYDFHGPSFIVDTACSSSLVALHSACQSLRSGESELAVVGGVELLLNPHNHILFSKAQVLAPDGVTRVFDRRAGGFVLGEGVGLALLKPLAAALRDGDQIQAVILGSAVNNDGHTMGLTTPNLHAQADVLETAYRNAGVSPSSISYLEAHGTGTNLGDPIEIKAATQVLRKHSSESQFCGVGSVKSNLGHLLRAAGITSFIKATLALRERMLPPTLHCEEPHPRFRFTESPFYPVTALQPWKPRDGVRRAGISGFGFGGTNCHIVMEEWDATARGYQPRRQARPATQFKRLLHSPGGGVRSSVPLLAVVKAAPPVSSEPVVVPAPSPQPPDPPKAALPGNLQAEVEQYMLTKVARLLSLPESQVGTDTNFMEMGIDSFALLQMTQDLEHETGIELYPTLFFEYQNLKELARYFVAEHGPMLAARLGLSRSAAEFVPAPVPAALHAPAQRPAASVTRELPPRVEGVESLRPTAAADRSDAAPPPRPSPANVSTRDIAVIGIAGRFARSSSVGEFWRHLEAGTDLIQEIPPDHFDYQPWFDPQPQAPNKLYCKWGSFLDSVDKFDAAFFRVAPQEAEMMDPQLRHLLEVMHETAEDAGYAGRIRGTRTGVYMGVCCHDYATELVRNGVGADPFGGTGNAATMIANRPSYLWDLRGPSMTLDTACSSSLVSLHVAVQALRNGECDMAFAGGANLLLGPYHYVYFCGIGALSPTGRCHSFDKQADGYVPGEAVACVLLKPLAKALEDGDPIHAVIKGSAVAHGGYANTVTAPNPKLEAEVMMAAWRDAGIHPESLGYIEAHGTGTKLGDPVEIQGIKQAFRHFTEKTGFCAVGTTKAHIGHAEGAAGIAGFVRTVLSLKHRRIPAMPGFGELNPLIQLAGSPLYINSGSVEFKSPGAGPLRAGVSSFGFGGTYAHIVVEADERIGSKPGEQTPATPEIVVLAARTEQGLFDMATRLSAWLDEPANRSLGLADIAHTLQVGREGFEERFAVVAHDRAELEKRLSQFVKERRAGAGTVRGTVQRHPATLLQAGNPEDERYLVDLFRNGRYDRIATYWAHGAAIPWGLFYAGHPRRCVSLPTYPFERQRYWYSDKGVAASPAKSPPTAPPARVLAPVETGEPGALGPLLSVPPSDIGRFLLENIARLLNVQPEQVDPQAPLTDLGLDSIKAMHLVKQIQENFSLQLYAAEVQAHPTLAELTRYLEGELRTGHSADAPAGVSQRPAAPSNGPVSRASAQPAATPLVFLLSTPRAGSTLLRVMLAGHPRLFCPPELHLLPFETLRERSGILSAKASFLAEGLTRAVMELEGATAEQAAAVVAGWERSGQPVLETYRWLMERSGRIVLDKSPSYGESLVTLQRAQTSFPQARYLFLTRHPLAVMESYVRNRFHKLHADPGEDPWRLAEAMWRRTNENLRAFLNSVPATQWLHVRYEELVSQPEANARRICGFLEVPYVPALLEPYEGKRMTDGLHEDSLSIGDPNFLRHRTIDPSLAEAWQQRLTTPPALCDETLALARDLGHTAIPGSDPVRAMGPAQRLFFAHFPAKPQWNILHRVELATEAPLDPGRFEQAWCGIALRHPQLRTVFPPARGGDGIEPRELGSVGPLPIQWLDLADRPEDQREEAVRLCLARMHEAIDPARWPLMQLAVVTTGPQRYEMLWVYHHLIGDGVSSHLILKELWPRYEDPQRVWPEPAPRYESYARHMASLAAEAQAHLAYWEPHARTLQPDLPLDGPGGDALASTERELDLIWQFDHGAKTPDFCALSVALYRTLSEWTGSRAPVISHRVHGRNVGNLHYGEVVGWFAFDVPIRLEVDPTLSTQALGAAFRGLWDAMPLNGTTYPGLVLAGALPSAHTVSPVRLNFQPAWEVPERAGVRSEVRDIWTCQPPELLRPYLLDLIVRVKPGRSRVIARYSASHHSEASIQRLLDQWRRRLEQSDSH